MAQSKIDDFILGVVNATNSLIASKLEEGIQIALDTLCDHLDISSSFIYKNHRNENGELLSSIKYFSSKTVIPERVARNQDVPLYRMEKLSKELAAGRPYMLVYSDSDSELRAHMGLDHTKLVAFFPIIVDDDFWGAIGFADFSKERKLSEPEKQLLMTLANAIAGSIRRERLESNLEQLVQQRTAELQDHKLRFQLALESTQNGFWDWLPQENKIFWSKNMYDNLGYEPGDLPDLIEGFYDLVHPHDRAEARRRFNNYLQNKVPYEMEFRLKKKDGSYRWFLSTCKAVWDEEGKPIRVVGSHADIHTRKVSTELLARQEEKFRTVIRTDPNPLFLVNKRGKIVLHSKRSCEVFGYSDEELNGLNVLRLLPPDKRSKYKQLLNDFLTKPRTQVLDSTAEIKARKKNGRLFWIEMGLSPVSIDGETMVLAVLTDVTRKREAELKLKESYRQMNNLINNLPGVVYRCRNDESWTMDYISPACEQITGYRQEEFYGDPAITTFGNLIIPDDRDEVWEHVQRSVNDQKPFRMTYRIKDKQGRIKWIWEQGVGVFENDMLVWLEGCLFDVTPIIRNQEKVQQAIYSTEDKERRRIASDLHDGVQQTLGVSYMNLKHLDEEVAKFSEALQKRYYKSLKYLEQGIKESRNIAHQLLPKDVEELGLVKALEQLISDTINGNGTEVEYYTNITARLPAEVELGLYRVAQETLNNIMKHAKASKISVQLIKTADENVQMMIEDNGVGFDKNKLDIYKEGYGLTSMKNRVWSMSGRLSVDSNPGKGTCLVAIIPAKLKVYE
ncbi:PAS domain-containing protein [Roseivirga thermotolerans]|jgi:PAS domain S-box-containing protein|uniref:histidine kinase n=1 Tax=Roseivirga thermotolerans TaxID=1758176 RepID=A0ABQ3IA56_9BACT|nr:PAS domain-containing protein [Roseivirga thermotolerans]GHE69095.1 hypothetical protein GCM10011340_26240 [Roseivirga thermotolerans]